jgi:hypothetical protein
MRVRVLCYVFHVAWNCLSSFAAAWLRIARTVRLQRLNVSAIFAVLLACLTITGCKQNDVLSDTNAFVDLSKDARKTGTALMQDYVASCTRIQARAKEYDAIRSSRVNLPPLALDATIDGACSIRNSTAVLIEKSLSIIFDYFDAISSVSGHTPPTFDSTSLLTSLGVSKTQAPNYNNIIDALAKIATAQSRYNAIKDAVPKTNKSVQAVLADMRVFFAPVCSDKLHFASIQAAYYEEDAAAWDQLSRLLAELQIGQAGSIVTIPPCAPAGGAAAAAAGGAAPKSLADAAALETFTSDYVSVLDNDRKERAAATAYDLALFKIAMAHQAIANRIADLPPPCPPPGPPPGVGAAAPKPTPMCQPLDQTSVITDPPVPSDVAQDLSEASAYLDEAKQFIHEVGQ